MTAAFDETRALRRRFRKGDLSKEDQNFLRILATLGLAAWCVMIWGQTLPKRMLEAPREEPIQVAEVRIKPPPPPEEKKEEPKPEPLPPRKAEQKPGPAPAPKAARPVVTAEKPKAPQKRAVASLGLLSMLSSSESRAESASQRIGPSLRNVDFREARDLTEDVGSLTGTVGAREKATIGEMVAGLPRGTGTKVVLEGRVVTPISGPGAPTVSGDGGGASGRTISEIRDVVASYIAGLKYLYDRELKKRPSLHGKLTVEFVVEPAGSVGSVRLVTSALDHPALENAILSRIRGWRFPSKPGDSTRVTFPFDFVAPTG